MSVTVPSAFRISGPQPLAVSDDLRRINAASVLRTILVEGPLARAQIADHLGLTRATVTRASGQLLEAGLLVEGAPRRTSPGRPLTPLELGGAGRVVITVHIGAIETRIGTVNIRGEVLDESRYRYEDTSPAGVAALIARGVAEAMEPVPPDLVLGISASIGGWVDPGSATIVSYRPLKWVDVPLESLIPNVGVPRYFDQLVRGLALAESMFGVARRTADFLEVWSGNVLGAALVSDGIVRRGPNGGAGGIDHFPTRSLGGQCYCGRLDCLHAIATDEAIVSAAVQRGILRPGGSLRTLVQVVDDGDAAARELVDQRAADLGRAVAVIVDLTSPALLVLAGLITTATGYQQAFESAFRATTDQAAGTRVITSGFGDLAPTVASASFLLDAFFHDPLAFVPVTLE